MVFFEQPNRQYLRYSLPTFFRVEPVYFSLLISSFALFSKFWSESEPSDFTSSFWDSSLSDSDPSESLELSLLSPSPLELELPDELLCWIITSGLPKSYQTK